MSEQNDKTNNNIEDKGSDNNKSKTSSSPEKSKKPKSLETVNFNNRKDRIRRYYIFNYKK